MPLRSGIPLLTELDAHLTSDIFRRHVEFNREFLRANDAAMEQYGKLWSKDTLRLWSRRWECPFTAERTVDFAAAEQARPGGESAPFHVLDAGSGVTYFPYYLCSRIPRCEVTCFDSNPTYHAMFEAVNRATPDAKVTFVQGMLQKMPFADGSFDAVCCISVLEHTSNYSEIVDEFRRVLRPGGLLVLTFDLSLDDKFELPRDTAERLLRELQAKFTVPAGGDLVAELARLDEPGSILTTDHVKKVEPDLLPWKYPMLKAAHDLLHGHGWTGGFRSKSVYCLDVRKP